MGIDGEFESHPCIGRDDVAAYEVEGHIPEFPGRLRGHKIGRLLFNFEMLASMLLHLC